MFISNHTLMGMLDTPLLMLGIYTETEHFPRSMGDHFHFKVPGWRELLRRFGVVHGTREGCRALMREEQSLLIFPGGGREVFKRRGEAYQLLWGKRSGFARLAREFAYTIIPVASIGAEECYKILMDQEDLRRIPGGENFLACSPRSDVAFPTLVRGLGWTPLPNPQRFYFHFGEPIESKPYQKWEDDDEAIFALREEVREALEALIAEGLAQREPPGPLGARLLKALFP